MESRDIEYNISTKTLKKIFIQIDETVICPLRLLGVREFKSKYSVQNVKLSVEFWVGFIKASTLTSLGLVGSDND